MKLPVALRQVVDGSPPIVMDISTDHKAGLLESGEQHRDAFEAR